MANNQNFIVRYGVSVNTTPVINTAGYWVGNPSVYEQSSYATANSKTKTYQQDTAPASPQYDDMWIDTTSGIEYKYINDTNGNQWVEFGPIGSPTGNLIFSDQTIIGNIPNRDITLSPQGTGNINLSFADTVTGNLIPINSISDIGSILNPYHDIFMANASIHMVANTYTGQNITLSNDEQNFIITNGGMKIAGGVFQANSVIGTSHLYSLNVENDFIATKGITYKTRNIAGTANTLIIDFATDTMIHLNTPSPGTIINVSFLNLANNAGKTIEIITKSSAGGTTQFNHNVSSSNATSGNSFFITSKQTMYIKYLNFDGTAGNTFVTATYN